MEILKIDHLGIAVNSIDDGKNFWSDVLGLKFEGAETVETQKVTTAFFPVGESEVELLESTSPDGKQKIQSSQSSAIKTEKTDGINILIHIMSQMNPDQEKKLREYLYLKLPGISDKIKERIFSFDAVVNLTHREVQILIDEINDDYVIAKSLKGAGDALRFKFLRNMSQNRATNILNEMKYCKAEKSQY